jgi:hypothetical protein
MLPILLTLVIAPQAAATPSYNEVLANMHRDYRALKGFKDTWTLSHEDVTLKVTRLIDGERANMVVMVGDRPAMESGHDGSAFYSINHEAKEYILGSGKNDIFTEKFEPVPVQMDAPGEFNFGVSSYYDLQLRVLPTPVVKRVEPVTVENKPLRLVTAAVRENGPRPATLKLWFERDAWILVRFEFSGTTPDNQPFTFTSSAKIERGLNIAPAQFKFDPSKAPGYKRIEG